ncbi:Ppx/GppA family phosphatase [uncultured Pelagimonas sp.]|uniref:Ppx/GppA family phosphatase n=1 Tax=uncultured Pelagimonas sp. TaxID=1618102 RepID=UPI002601AB49|nr:Ppx/GppA family phosphatase [uncultured Pelagimonas sp.]
MQDSLPQDDWAQFGQPLFDDPKSRALSRVGVVDIGSNSVRMVVFDGAARSPAYFFNEKILCGLGAGMNETGHLNPEGKDRALVALRRFQCLADGMDLPPLTVVATAAMRDAQDGPSFRDQIEAETGLKVYVIDGNEEARLSAQGVLLGWPGSYGLICDIGGSSMELAEINHGEVGRRISSSLGPLKLMDIEGGRPAREKQIGTVMKELKDHMGKQRDRLFLVGGSWRALAKVDMERRNYPLHVLHEYRMDTESVAKTIEFLGEHDPEELRRKCGISSTRMGLLPYAAEVLSELLVRFKPKDIAISSYGIREGMLYEQMSEELRRRDPLIEASRFAEAKDARIPGFGKRLYDFVKPLFPDADAPRRRLIKAACLMHDVSWRAHPDYRAEICFDNATRANLGGLKHSERVFLGIALLYRYRNKPEGTHFEPLFDLVDKEDQLQAEILGKAMRLGAMLWMEKLTKEEAHLEWKPAKRKLSLHLSENSAPLYGEVTEARFNSLAATLEAEEHSVETS